LPLNQTSPSTRITYISNNVQLYGCRNASAKVQLQVVLSQWCIWGCRSLGWQSLRRPVPSIWRSIVPSSCLTLESEGTISLQNIRDRIPAAHCFIPKDLNPLKCSYLLLWNWFYKENTQVKGIQDKQTKSQTGKTFIQW